MSKTDSVRLSYVLKLISDLETIVKNHRTVLETLNSLEGSYAVTMCIMQIGETLNKLTDENLRAQLPVQQAYGLRNILAHHYDSVDLDRIFEIITTYIPEMEKTIERLLENDHV